MKKIITLCLSLLMIVSLVGCGSKTEVLEKGKDKEAVKQETVNNQEQTNEEEPSGEVAPENEISLDMSKSEMAAYDFVKAIQACDYETAMSFLEIDSTYITAEDFGWFMPRSSLGDLVDSTYELKEVTSEKTKPNDSVTLVVGPVTANITTFLNDDNEWKVKFDEAIITNWEVVVPKGMGLKINGTDVDKNLIKSVDERNETYEIPNIIIKEVELTAVSETLGEFTTKTNPSEEQYKISCELDEATMNEVYEGLKVTLNSINEAYENGARDTSEFSEFISDYADTDFATILANSVDTQYTWNSGLNPTNIRYTRILPRVDDSKYLPCFLYTTNKIAVNVRVEKTWDNESGNSDGTHIYGWIIVEKTDNGIKLVSMAGDKNLVTARNSATREWKD